MSVGRRRAAPRPTSSARWAGAAASVWGVGIDGNIVTASLKAVLSAVNRVARGQAQA